MNLDVLGTKALKNHELCFTSVSWTGLATPSANSCKPLLEKMGWKNQLHHYHNDKTEPLVNIAQGKEALPNVEQKQGTSKEKITETPNSPKSLAWTDLREAPTTTHRKWKTADIDNSSNWCKHYQTVSVYQSQKKWSNERCYKAEAVNFHRPNAYTVHLFKLLCLWQLCQ